MAREPRLVAAIHGDLDRMMAAEIRNAERGITAGVEAGAKGLQADLRGQVKRAGLGRKVSNAWRRRRFPKTGVSMSAAATVFSKAPHIVRAFDEGALIRGKTGLWLAIPTENAPRKGVGGKRINPTNFPEHRFGRLRFIYRAGKPGLLVIDNVRIGKTGRVGRRSKSPTLKSGALRKGLTTVVMFVLVRQARLKKRLDVDGARGRWERRLPGLIVTEMTRADREDSRR